MYLYLPAPSPLRTKPCGVAFYKRVLLSAGIALGAIGLTGCTSLGADGPTTGQITGANGTPLAESVIEVVELDGASTEKLKAFHTPRLFSDTFGDAAALGSVVGMGDVLEVSITEAPPAVLFGGAAGDSPLRSPSAASAVQPVSSSLGWTSPQQSIDREGTIFVPFAGLIPAAGQSLRQIERTITERLRNKAHQPQVIVRRVGNATATVTVLGDVAQSGRIPITAHGERLLEVIAAAGGSKQPLSRTVVQISRDQQVLTLPMSQVIGDPRQNIVMRPDDIVSLLFQPYSFTALGASGQSNEVSFEGADFNLANALGRIGGLDETRANPKGVFVFRFEDASVLDQTSIAGKPRTTDGKVPVIYRVNLRTPTSLFLIQRFPMQHQDVVFVSNAPLVDFSKFLGIISSTVFSTAGVVQLTR
jgi:polysaccharide export outer membrane protein